MRFDVSSTALLSRLQSISKVIASKNSLPILDSFLFNLEGNKLTITASDAETRLVTSVDVMNAQGSGLFAVSAKILLDPLKELPEQPLTFDINDDNLEIFIHFQNGKYNFIGQKGDTYPQQKPFNDNAISIMMDAQMLLNGISRALFATADDELRPVMNGIYFDIHTDDLTFVASDGHKLVRLRNLSVKSPERASFILPKKPAMPFLRRTSMRGLLAILTTVGSLRAIRLSISSRWRTLCMMRSRCVSLAANSIRSVSTCAGRTKRTHSRRSASSRLSRRSRWAR